MVLRIVMLVDAPMGMGLAIKEALAMQVEKYGDVTVSVVEEIGKEESNAVRMQRAPGGAKGTGHRGA